MIEWTARLCRIPWSAGRCCGRTCGKCWRTPPSSRAPPRARCWSSCTSACPRSGARRRLAHGRHRRHQCSRQPPTAAPLLSHSSMLPAKTCSPQAKAAPLHLAGRMQGLAAAVAEKGTAARCCRCSSTPWPSWCTCWWRRFGRRLRGVHSRVQPSAARRPLPPLDLAAPLGHLQLHLHLELEQARVQAQPPQQRGLGEETHQAQCPIKPLSRCPCSRCCLAPRAATAPRPTHLTHAWPPSCWHA